MELDQNPLREQERRGEAERRLESRRGVSVPSVQLARIGQEKETKSKNNKKRKLSWFPAAVLFLCLLVLTIRAAPANSNIKPLLFVDGLARVDYPSVRWRSGSNLLYPAVRTKMRLGSKVRRVGAGRPEEEWSFWSNV